MTLADSCVLIDVIDEDPRWGIASAEALAAALGTGGIVIDPVVLAELHGRARPDRKLEAMLDLYDIAVRPLPVEAARVAGAAFREYRNLGGRQNAILADFLIGAHAAVLGATLLTRDRARFASYFPELPLITPESAHP